MAVNLNQFKLTNRAGVVMNPAANVIQCQILPSLATTSYYSAGQVVAFGTDSGSTPIVRAVASTGCGIGIIVYNMKTDKYYARYICGVALEGSIITCNADAAMTRGNIVAWGSGGVRAIGATNAFGIGITIDNASAANDIVRVLIKPGVTGTAGLGWQA
jgi:hypothetical protein